MRTRHFQAECELAIITARDIITFWDNGSRSTAAEKFQAVPQHRQALVAAMVAYEFRHVGVQDILDGVHFLATHPDTDTNGGSQ